MTPIDDATEELLSRGLDADLDRREMRTLYRCAADDPSVPPAMGAMARVETALHAADAPVAAAAAPDSVADGLRRVTGDRSSGDSPSWPVRLGRWLKAPQGIAFQPLSFAGGAALAVLLAVAATPAVIPHVPAAQRLSVHDLRFVDAQDDLDWTYRFILHPGQSTRVALDLGDTLPLAVRVEAPETTRLALVHEAPGLWRGDTRRELTVDGIRYATLRNPRPGDALVLTNLGAAPAVVYAYTNGYGGSWVSPQTTPL